jgi:hypothetical protein
VPVPARRIPLLSTATPRFATRAEAATKRRDAVDAGLTDIDILDVASDFIRCYRLH